MHGRGQLCGLTQGLFELVLEGPVQRAVAGDHLEGVLFVDKLSGLKKQLFRRWFKKLIAAVE